MWVLGGHKLKSLLQLSNGFTDWHQIWHTCADSSVNGYTPNKLPFERQGGHIGVLGGQTLKKVWTSCQTAGPIGTNFGSRLRIHLGMDIGSIQVVPQYPRGHFWGFEGSQIQMNEEAVKLPDRLAPNSVHVCGFVWEWT